jgi:4-amino-4-deoxy-L-arabinose transferase-like glycosyltransferase
MKSGLDVFEGGEVGPDLRGAAVTWWRDLLLLAVAVGVLYFAFLGVRPLNNPDEGRYAEIPREMAATGDYVTPRLNGVKYFEKPPLMYWASALAFEVAGVSEFTARFGNAAFALAGVLLAYAAGRALYGRRAGWWSAAVLATTLLYFGLGQIVLLDMAVAVTISAALFAFLFAMRQPPGAARWWLFMAFYASMALAVLTKGLIGFLLPCAVAFVWVCVCNRWRALWPFYPVTGTLVLLGIAAPWHVLAGLANHSDVKEYDFTWFYFVHEHWLRFTTKIHGRYEPWWFFLPVLVGGLFPWTVFAWQALRGSLKGGWSGRHESREAWFLVIWIGFILLFFSKSDSKLIPYILPVFPAAAVLIGAYLAGAWRAAGPGGPGVRAGLWVLAGVAAILALAITAVPVPSKYTELISVLAPWRVVFGVVFGGGAIAMGTSLWRGSVRGALMSSVVMCVAFYLPFNFVGKAFDVRSTKELALTLKPLLAPGDAVFTVGTYTQDLPVYLGRMVDVVKYRGELSFGVDSEPEVSASRFISGEAFARRWAQPEVAYAVVAKKALVSSWPGDNLPFSVLAETPRYSLVVNRATPTAPTP